MKAAIVLLVLVHTLPSMRANTQFYASPGTCLPHQSTMLKAIPRIARQLGRPAGRGFSALPAVSSAVGTAKHTLEVKQLRMSSTVGAQPQL